MRALGVFLIRAVHVLAWIVVGASGLLLGLEESGVLGLALEKQIAWRLGPLGAGLEIGGVDLRWFEPGIVVSDVQLTARDPEGEAVELVYLGRVHFSIDPNLDERPLRRLSVEGGRVRVSDELARGLERFAASLEGGEAGPLELPPIVVTDFELAVELPDESVFEVGVVDLVATPLENGAIELAGDLDPTFANAVPGSGAIQVRGSQDVDGTLRVRATSSRLPLETEGFQMPPSLGPLPIEAFAGLLTLEAYGSLDLKSGFEASGNLRAQLEEGRLKPSADAPWLENLSIDLDAEVALSDGEDLWRREAWNTVLRARTNLRSEVAGSIETPVEVWGLFGRRVPAGAWARAFVRVARLPLAEHAFRALPEEARHVLAELNEALELGGVADVTADALVERSRRTPEGTLYDYTFRSAGHASHTGGSSLVYRGFPASGPYALPGDRLGVPMPVGGIEGDIVWSFDQERARRLWLGFAGLTGRHATGDVSAWGSITERSPRAPRDPPGPYLDIGVHVPPTTLDSAWQDVLSSAFVTRPIWFDYQPRVGARAGAELELRDAPGTAGLSATLDVEVVDAELAWRELPVPMPGSHGRLKLRWGPRTARIDYGGRERQPEELYGRRAFGVAWDLSSQDARGLSAHVRGMYREEDLPFVIPYSPDPLDTGFWGLELEIDRLPLGDTSSSFQVLKDELEPVRELAADLKPAGFLEAAFEGIQPAAFRPFEAHLTATPLEARVTPVEFPLQAIDLSGRMLSRMVWLDPESTDDEGTPDSSDARAQLTGHWRMGALVPLAADLELWTEEPIALDAPPRDLAALRVLGAGVDPNNPGIRGAFRDTMTEDEPGATKIDLSQTSLSGVLDFDFRSRWELDSVDEPLAEYEVFLRGASLANGGLRLDGIDGMMRGQDEILRGDHLRAELAGHPVSLDDVLVFPVDQAGSIDGVDPLVFERRFLTEEPGILTQARVTVDDLPLDVEHLSSLLEPEELLVLEENPSWSGFLDIQGATLLITGPEEGEGIVVLRGPVRPHDVELSFGMPVVVSTANLDVHEFVLERGGIRAWASIQGLDATIADRELENASMILTLVDGRVSIEDLDGEFVGGRLQSLGATGQGARKALGVDLEEPHRFDIAVTMQDVEVDRLLSGVFQSSVADAGYLRANLQLSGTPKDVLGLTGRGQLRLTEGRLWSVPAVRAVFSSLGFPNTGVFDDLETRFEIRDGVIDTHYLLVKSSLLKLFGSGTLDLDGRLAYDLDVRYSILDRLGILNKLIYWLNRNLIRVAVRGDFARPEVLIRSSFFELFRGRPDTERRGLPLPDFAPLGRRF